MRLIVFLLTLMAAGEVAAQALPGGEGRRMVVQGEGRVMAAPDQATLDLGVVETADSAADALAATSRAMTSVAEAIRGLDLSIVNLQTRGVSLSPVYRLSDDPQGREITGYEARNGLTVTVSGTSDLGRLIDTAVSSGANNLGGIAFELDDRDAAAAEARRRAVADARTRAETYAEAAGVTLGSIRALSDVAVGAQPGPPMRMQMAEGGTPVEAGQITVEATVMVEWILGDG